MSSEESIPWLLVCWASPAQEPYEDFQVILPLLQQGCILD